MCVRMEWHCCMQTFVLVDLGRYIEWKLLGSIANDVAPRNMALVEMGMQVTRLTWLCQWFWIHHRMTFVIYKYFFFYFLRRKKKIRRHKQKNQLKLHASMLNCLSAKEMKLQDKWKWHFFFLFLCNACLPHHYNSLSIAQQRRTNRSNKKLWSLRQTTLMFVFVCRLHSI